MSTVASRSTAGSGRVPHQKYRTSYSSQSEDDSTQKSVVRRSGKRSFQSFRGEDNNKVNQASDKCEKVSTFDDDMVVKPPLHPNTERKSEPMKPKKQRGRYMKSDNRNRQREKLQNVSHESIAIKEIDSSSKDDVVSGDDGWEDVATSGTESMSEDMLPKEQKEETNIVDSEVGSETNNPSDMEKCENDKNEVVNVEVVGVETNIEYNKSEAEICPGTNDQVINIDKCEGDKERANDNVDLMSKENTFIIEQLCSATEEICAETKDGSVDADKCGSNDVNVNLKTVNMEKAVNIEENNTNQPEEVICQQKTDKQVEMDKYESIKESADKNVELVSIETSVNILKQLSETENKPTGTDECESNSSRVNANAEIVDMEKHVNHGNVSKKDIKNDDMEIIKKELSVGMKSHENIEDLTDTIDTNQEIRGACEIESCSKILTSEVQTILNTQESLSNDGKLTADDKAVKSDVDTNED